MLSPVAWHHYLLLLTIPFVQMVASVSQGRSSSRALWMAATAYILSAVSLRISNRFLVPPPTAFQIDFPWLVRAIEENAASSQLCAKMEALARELASGLLSKSP